MMSRITKLIEKRPLSEKKKQWLWFITLWLLGLMCVSLIGLMVKGIIRIAG